MTVAVLTNRVPTESPFVDNKSASGVSWPWIRFFQGLLLAIYLNRYTVVKLPAGTEGRIAFATNGRKVGEGPGAGTGVPVYFSNGFWRVFSTDAAVTS